MLGTIGKTGITKIIVTDSEDLKYYWGREICKSMGVKHISTFLFFLFFSVDSCFKVDNSTLLILCNFNYEFC